MAKPIKRMNFRTMAQEEIFSCNIQECKRAISSCRVALSQAKKYNDIIKVDELTEQMGAFSIQIDMIERGDIKPEDWL